MFKNPNDALPWFEQAETLENLGRYDDAVALYCRGLEVDPNSWLAWNSLGICYAMLRKWNAAIDSFHHAWALDAKRSEAKLNEGKVWAEGLGDYLKALKCFEVAAELGNAAAAEYAKRLRATERHYIYRDVNTVGKVEHVQSELGCILKLLNQDPSLWSDRLDLLEKEVMSIWQSVRTQEMMSILGGLAGVFRHLKQTSREIGMLENLCTLAEEHLAAIGRARSNEDVRATGVDFVLLGTAYLIGRRTPDAKRALNIGQQLLVSIGWSVEVAKLLAGEEARMGPEPVAQSKMRWTPQIATWTTR